MQPICISTTNCNTSFLLNDIINFDAIAKFPSPAYTLKQASSYDRRSVSPDNPGWFENDDHDQFIRKGKTRAAMKKYVMMNEDGPGVLHAFG